MIIFQNCTELTPPAASPCRQWAVVFPSSSNSRGFSAFAQPLPSGRPSPPAGTEREQTTATPPRSTAHPPQLARIYKLETRYIVHLDRDRTLGFQRVLGDLHCAEMPACHEH